MAHRPVKNGSRPAARFTRRQVLGAAAAAMGLMGERSAAQDGRVIAQGDPGVGELPRIPPPWWMERLGPRSRVVEVHSQKVLQHSIVDPLVLRQMLTQGVRTLTGTLSPQAAWRELLGDARRIVLKFNSVGANVLSTTDPMARAIVEALEVAGYDVGAVGLVEAPSYLPSRLGTRLPAGGWGEPIQVGGQLEPLAAYVYEADAIINVAFLKTHQIAGLSGCLKNLSHAVIRHPARYHANWCSPYVAQVVGSEAVSSRLRLNLVNALRVVVDRGPDANPEDVVDYRGLLLGVDPVAVDRVGLSVLTAERARLGLVQDLRVPSLTDAARMGLGRVRPEGIERRQALGVD